MWTYNENNNAKSKASRKEKDSNLSAIYNKTVLALSSDEEEQIFNTRFDEPLVIDSRFDGPLVIDSRLDEPLIIDSRLDGPLVIDSRLDEVDVFRPDSNLIQMDEDLNTDDDAYSFTTCSSSEIEIEQDETDSEFEFDLDEFIESADNYEKQIYKHSEIKLKHFIIIFTATFTGLKISKKILNKFLKFVRAILPKDELNIPKTLDSMNKFYEISKIQTIKICSKCSDTLSNESICEKRECLRFKNSKKNKNKLDPILTEFEFTNELRLLLEKNWPTIIEYRMTLSRNLVSDICNSAHYTSKQLSINNISLCLFIDGAQFNKSNNGTIWAILGIVANLPPLIRSAFNNLIKILFIHGTLFDFNGIFAKHLSKLKSLLANGLTIMVSNCETKITVNIHALIADNPGRAKICYCRQHNGRFGCFHCLSQCYTTDGEK